MVIRMILSMYSIAMLYILRCMAMILIGGHVDISTALIVITLLTMVYVMSVCNGAFRRFCHEIGEWTVHYSVSSGVNKVMSLYVMSCQFLLLRLMI